MAAIQLTAEALKAAGIPDDAKSETAQTTTTSSGVKRKRGNDLKFYAVKAGHKPDIYHSWADCKFQVTGFKGAVYKSFTSLTEAEAFMKSTGNSPPSNGPKKFYAVQNGRKPGVYEDWPSAQQQITGWTKPKHRSFTTRAEAEAFVREGVSNGSAVPNVGVDGDTSSTARDTDSPAPKKAKTTKAKAVVADGGPIDPGWAPLPPDAEDGFDRRQIMDPVTGQLRWKTEEELNAKKAVLKLDNFAEPLRIWTDGACRGNGKKGAVAGVGVYFGKNDPRNVSEALPGTRQTNQRAELTALKRALAIAPLNRPVTIYSDSSYSINCVTTWFQKWQKNDWVNASGKAVENKDLIKEILEIIHGREVGGVKTKFEWVKGHGTDEGNTEADRLAVAGAEAARKNIAVNGEEKGKSE